MCNADIDQMELSMLTAALQLAVAYRDIEPETLFKVSKTLNDWAHADAQNRRIIYRAWQSTT